MGWQNVNGGEYFVNMGVGRHCWISGDGGGGYHCLIAIHHFVEGGFADDVGDVAAMSSGNLCNYLVLKQRKQKISILFSLLLRNH